MDKYLSEEFKMQLIYKPLCRMILKYGNVIKNLQDEDFKDYRYSDNKKIGIMAHKIVNELYSSFYVYIGKNGNEIAITAETKPFARGNIMIDKITAIYDTDSSSITYGESTLDFERELNGKIIEKNTISVNNNVAVVNNYKNEELSSDDTLLALIVDNMTKTQQKKLSRGWK